MEILDAFDKYTESGIEVLPTKKDKTPDVSMSWKDNVLPRELFEGAHGIAVKCGDPSSGLTVLDFDNKFGDIKQLFKKFMSDTSVHEIYEKYKLPIESTVSNGYHLLFRTNLPIASMKLARRVDDKGKPVTMIETKGVGGYTIVYPTPGYDLKRNDIFYIDLIGDEDANTLIEVAKSFNEYETPDRAKAIPYKYLDSQRPGDFFNDMPDAVESMIASLKRAGWTHVENHKWRRPGKDRGVSGTIGMVAPNIFYNFSSNGDPFEERTCYTPFQVLAILEYGGNFSEFAKEIKEKYMDMPGPSKPKQKLESKKDVEDVIEKAYLDPNKEYDAPPVAMYISHRYGMSSEWHRLMTLSNFSSLQGKAKSKKTYLLSLLAGVAAKGGADEEFQISSKDIPGKDIVLIFDTEESDYDAHKVQKRTMKMAEKNESCIKYYTLREYDSDERLEIVLNVIDKYKDRIFIIFIDGVADLLPTINDEKVSKSIVNNFMRLTKKYNMHICFILHQGRKDNLGMGWIGTVIMQKSELIMGVQEHKEHPKYSVVSCEFIRGVKPFEPFAFFINDDELPQINMHFNSKEELF